MTETARPYNGRMEIFMQNVAILGFGTVGSGVAQVLTENAEKMTASAGQEIKLKYIVDIRQFPDSPFAPLFTDDFSTVENDPEVDIVIETIGGVKAAYDFTLRSLKAGKSVVTSNKELVATKGTELMRIAEENGVSYLFEASVGGAIPVLRPIKECLTADRISEIYGILNGTTNFILTEMYQHGSSFSSALSRAQELGYSELNPSADIDGHDACRKISILASLMTGRGIHPSLVPAEGITGVTAEDVEFAGLAGYVIKLLGRAVMGPDGKVCAYVAPHLVKSGNMLSGVDGVMNGIVVNCNMSGNIMFYGAGAGMLPTAGAVAADVVEIARDKKCGGIYAWEEDDGNTAGDPQELAGSWYVRAEAGADELKKQFRDMRFIGDKDGKTAFITCEHSRLEMDKLLKDFSVLSMFRILD